MPDLLPDALAALPNDLGSRHWVRDAAGLILQNDEATLDTQIELTRIPAPPFKEGERGLRMAEIFREAGLVRVRTDPVGNVLAELPEAPSDRQPLILSAHLDTIFPDGTEVEVSQDGTRLRGPGIADDGRGLAVIVAIARALVETGARLPAPLLIAATVGEEGLGDLRGVRELFSEGREGRGAAGFISVDGAGLEQLVSVGLGSRRYRVTVKGPGGHSWSDWGRPNPIHALGEAIGRLSTYALPSDPIATLSVGRWGGGTSVNAIPFEAWLEVDIRSPSSEALARVDGAFLRTVERAVEEVNSRSNLDGGDLSLSITPIGARPAGNTAWDHALIESARAATRALGVEPEMSVASTDANVPMSLGIPALTMGGGGSAGGMHTLEEWYDNEGGALGVLRALFTTLLALESAA
jgi:tripeptide aminopeptidase